jgi:hypothetical protein
MTSTSGAKKKRFENLDYLQGNPVKTRAGEEPSRLALVELAILSSERYECSGYGPSLVNRMRRHAYTACLRHPDAPDRRKARRRVTADSLAARGSWHLAQEDSDEYRR